MWLYSSLSFSCTQTSLGIEEVLTEVKRNRQDLGVADIKQKQQGERETAKVLAAHKTALRAAVKQPAHSSPLAATEHTFSKSPMAAAPISKNYIDGRTKMLR